MNIPLSRHRLALACCAALFATFAAQAQDASTTQDAQTLDTVVVTGTLEGYTRDGAKEAKS